MPECVLLQAANMRSTELDTTMNRIHCDYSLMKINEAVKQLQCNATLLIPR